MNKDWEYELRSLEADQADLHLRLENLDGRMKRLRLQVEASSPAPKSAFSHQAVPLPTAQLPSLPPRPSNAKPPRIFPDPIPKKTAPPPPPAAPSTEGLELQVGKYWLVRIGVLVLLTGLVLLGNLAYQSVITTFGAAGKLSLLLLTSGTLLGLGLWLEKRIEKVRSYARVLMAGGAAGIYYTVYAAHFNAALRVIENPFWGGGLLLLVAGSFVWFAERRRSQSTAFAAICLAYYTSAIHPAAGFTLFSNLLLTTLAAYFLLRHRWMHVSWLALVGSYASFAYWRLPDFSLSADLVSSHGFLLAYWILFTLAIFLNRASAFPAVPRSYFITANNGAFFALAAPTVAKNFPDVFWLFCLTYGLVLLGLQALALRIKHEETLFDGTYLTQGILLVSLGFLTHFTGYQLALILMLESSALLYLSRFRHGFLLQFLAGLAAWAAFRFSVLSYSEPICFALLALLFLNLRQVRSNLPKETRSRFHWRAFVYAFPAVVLTAVWLFHRLSGPELAWAFAIAALIFTLGSLFLRYPEVTFLAQFFMPTGLGLLLMTPLRGATLWPFLLVTTLLMHIWQGYRSHFPKAALIFEALHAVLLSVVLYVWLLDWHAPLVSVLCTSASLGLGMWIYGWLTRSHFVVAISQIFTLSGAIVFLQIALRGDEVNAWFTLAVWLAFAFQAGTLRFLPIQDALIERLSFVYRTSVAILGLFWISLTFPISTHFFLMTLAGTLVFAFATRWPRLEALWISIICIAAGLLTYLMNIEHGFSGYHILGFVLLVSIPQLAKHLHSEILRFPQTLQNTFSIFGVLGIWFEVSRWTWMSDSNIPLSLVWAVLALGLLGIGFLLHERTYRLMGLLILSIAVGHVFLIEVWGLGQLARVLGIVGLGFILLVIGYVYNRFGEHIKKWL